MRGGRSLCVFRGGRISDGMRFGNVLCGCDVGSHCASKTWWVVVLFEDSDLDDGGLDRKSVV